MKGAAFFYVKSNCSGSTFRGSGFKVRMIKGRFDSKPNAEFIQFLQNARCYFTQIRSQFYVAEEI